MSLKRQIPSHIYDRAESKLGKPDFYVGPTVVEKRDLNGSPRARQRDDDLKRRMEEAKKASDQVGQEEGRQSPMSLIVRFFTRGKSRLRTAR